MENKITLVAIIIGAVIFVQVLFLATMPVLVAPLSWVFITPSLVGIAAIVHILKSKGNNHA